MSKNITAAQLISHVMRSCRADALKLFLNLSASPNCKVKTDADIVCAGENASDSVRSERRFRRSSHSLLVVKSI